jgi:predicted Zn-dependent peptidase
MARTTNKGIVILAAGAAIILALFCAGPAAAGEPAQSSAVDPRKMEFPPLEFKVPKADRTVLPNGMVVYALEDHLLPIINITSAVNVGEIYVLAEKAGLASLTGDIMRTGGTKKMTGDEVDEALEYVAASVSVDIDRERGTASMFCLKKDFDSTLALFADILMHPRFAQDKIDKRKKELMESFRRENDLPDEIAGREFRKLIYKEHPYARRTTGYPDTVEKISREDLVAFHAKFFHPNNVILGVSGDFERQEMLEKLRGAFADWKNEKIDFPPVAALPEDFQRSLNFIKKDINQSNVLLGHLGLERLNPDFYAVTVMNFILGEDFTSRLVESVRTKGGLAYSVGSDFLMPRYKGMFVCYFQTANPQSFGAVEKTLAELERIRTEKVPPEEFKRAKDAISNRFVFNFATASGIVSRFVSIEFEGLPRDYFDTYLDKIAAITPDDILRVANKYIHPDKITLLVVGNDEAPKSFPETWGKFNVIELSSPASDEPPASLAEQ